MRVAITGGTGFGGRHLARALVTNGNAVVLIARGILAEGLVEAAPPCDTLPADLEPTRGFTPEQIQKHLPEPGPFRLRDLRCVRT